MVEGNIQAMPCRFLYCYDHGDPTKFIEFSPTDYDSEKFRPDANYHFKVLRKVEELLGDSNLTFIVTWDIQNLPIYGDHVIPYVLGDEHFQIPSYVKKVGAIIKSMGSINWHETHGSHGHPLMNFSEYCKRNLIRFKTKKRNKQYGIAESDIAKIITIPLGYYNFVPQNYINLPDRKWDVFFAGALKTLPRFPHSLAAFVRPLAVARQQMAKAYRQAQIRHANLVCYPDLSDPKSHLTRFNSEEYSSQMSNAKVALCPRGSHPETFRFFEAAQCGCIILCDPLPPHWYYKDCPAIIVENWKRLPAKLEELIASPSEMLELSQRTHEWFNTVVHPDAIGEVTAQFIREKRNFTT